MNNDGKVSFGCPFLFVCMTRRYSYPEITTGRKLVSPASAENSAEASAVDGTSTVFNQKPSDLFTEIHHFWAKRVDLLQNVSIRSGVLNSHDDKHYHRTETEQVTTSWWGLQGRSASAADGRLFRCGYTFRIKSQHRTEARVTPTANSPQQNPPLKNHNYQREYALTNT